MQATDKQISFILTLWNRLGRGQAAFLNQTDLPLNGRQRRGNLTRAEATAIIDELQAELKGARS